MPTDSIEIRFEAPEDDTAIDLIHVAAFGPGRFARTAFRLREGVSPDPSLSFTAWADGRLVGSVRLTPITMGKAPALLLGPLAVLPEFKNRGTGKSLVAHAVTTAQQTGHKLVLLVGDEPYYGPLGFRRVPHGSVVLPGPVDPDRILVAELCAGAMADATGPVRSTVAGGPRHGATERCLTVLVGATGLRGTRSSTARRSGAPGRSGRRATGTGRCLSGRWRLSFSGRSSPSRKTARRGAG